MTPALAPPGITPAAFNSWLTQPLFTELANLPQNALFATEQMGLRSPRAANSKTIVIEFRKIFFTFQSAHDKHYDSTLRAFRIHE
jgi:hypothetical protein